jgi:hypothetical protein
MSSPIVGKSKCSYAFLEISYFSDLEKLGAVGVPNRTMHETGPELFQRHKFGTVPVKTGRTGTHYRHRVIIARRNVTSAGAGGSQSEGLRQNQGAQSATALRFRSCLPLQLSSKAGARILEGRRLINKYKPAAHPAILTLSRFAFPAAETSRRRCYQNGGECRVR